MTLCEALQAAQNRGTVDSGIPARVKLSVGWYQTPDRPELTPNQLDATTQLLWVQRRLMPTINELVALQVRHAVQAATGALQLRIRQLEQELARTRTAVAKAVERADAA